jgi:hypothetical protein
MLKEIGSSIWQAEGPKRGPHVVIIGGTHGDERTGIFTMPRLLRKRPMALYFTLGPPARLMRYCRTLIIASSVLFKSLQYYGAVNIRAAG